MSRTRVLDKWMSAAEAAALITDADTVALVGGGGGLLEAAALFDAVENRFLAGRGPHNLTLTHALGIGDRQSLGLNRFAHRGLVKRVVGGHWVWSPRMQQLAHENAIEAYALPAGVMMQVMREIGAGRPGLLSRIGLGTYVDPRLGGGRMNEAAPEDLVELVEIAGDEWLRYKPFPVNVALLRGTLADAHGNVSLDGEAAKLDIFAVALACRNSGGKVIVQVRERVEPGAIPPHRVSIPAALVDAVVLAPDQQLAHGLVDDPSVTGADPRLDHPKRAPSGHQALERGIRRIIGGRAAEELHEGDVINFGFGFPDAVAALLVERDTVDRFYQTIEHGTHGGELMTGTLFGFARHASAMIDGPSQFDWYNGGGLDCAFLGFGEVDRDGNVNASKLGGVAVGPGGFIDISQSARTVVFCGTFDAKGTEYDITPSGLRITRHGSINKFVNSVAQITFSGRRAIATNQRVLFVTERAVLELQPNGLCVTGVAPGIDVETDVVNRIPFAVRIASSLAVYDLAHFAAACQ